MFDLLADELVVLGIGGAILVSGCMTETLSPITVRLVAFLLGVVMLALALVEIVTR